MQALQSCLSSESPRAAPERHRHHQHRPESPRCASVARLAAVLVARFTRSCGPYFVVLSEAHRPLSFPPCRPDGPAVPRSRTGQQFPEAGRAGDSGRLIRIVLPGGRTGWPSLDSHPTATRLPSRLRSSSLVSLAPVVLTPRTIWLAESPVSPPCGRAVQATREPARAGETVKMLRREVGENVASGGS